MNDKESKKFIVIAQGNSIILSFLSQETNNGHVESFPAKVAIAMGNQLLRVGQQVLKGEYNVK